MKESNQRRNDPNHDDFWKFLSFLLYFFLNVSKFLATDPIKKLKTPDGKCSESRLQYVLEKKLQIPLIMFFT